jgi:Predicted flavin-nucleotide-binding protein
MSRFTRTRGFIPRNKVDTWLKGFRSIWVSTTRPDGRPHATPVWYLWNEEHIYFASNKKSQKARNLARQPQIVVHAGDGDDVIILEGIVEVVTDPSEWAQVNIAYMEKYVDPHSGAKASIEDTDNLYRVNVRRIMSWEYGVVSTRTDWLNDKTS